MGLDLACGDGGRRRFGGGNGWFLRSRLGAFAWWRPVGVGSRICGLEGCRAVSSQRRSWLAKWEEERGVIKAWRAGGMGLGPPSEEGRLLVDQRSGAAAAAAGCICCCQGET